MESRTLLTIVRLYIALLVVIMLAELLGLIDNGQPSLERSQFILVVLLLGLVGILGIQSLNFRREHERSAKRQAANVGHV